MAASSFDGQHFDVLSATSTKTVANCLAGDRAGAHITVAGAEDEHLYHGKHGYPCLSDGAIRDMEAADFHGAILGRPAGRPTGSAAIRDVLALCWAFHGEGKLIAAICHGGWIAISAGVYRGVRVTGSPGIKDYLLNAGALWEDAPAVIDRHFVSSRRPDDLPQFCRAIFQALGVAVPASPVHEHALY